MLIVENPTFQVLQISPDYKFFFQSSLGEVCFAEGRSCTARAIISTIQGPRLVFAKMFLKVIKKEFIASLEELFELKRILMFELFFQENITKEINFINHLFSEA